MSVPLLIEEIDLERALGTQRFRELTDPNNSGSAHADIVRDLLQTASDEACGLLADGFTPDEAVGLVRADASLRKKIAIVGLGVALMLKTEFFDATGKFILADSYDRARKDLEQLGEKKKRSVAEQQNGTLNRQIGPRVGRPGGRRGTKPWVFRGGPF